LLSQALPGISSAVAADRVLLPVPSAVIYPGDVIDAGQLADRAFPANAAGLDGVIDDADELIGMVARRTLLPHRPIAASAIKEQVLVSRGMPVQLVYDHGGLVITAVATPLQSGGLGDAVRVRNVDSGVVVLGIVEAAGRVRVGAQ
jgi:flagella basal body P-ring formation protein FlgA